MDGLLGLTESTNNRESAIRDLGVLERMGDKVKQEQQEELAAQQQKEQIAERMYAMSDQLLEKDRIAINKRIAMSQSQIQSHLNEYGGSKKDFMSNGGLSVMNKISNDIIRSPEAIRYQENQKNLAKVLEAKEKGLGHLLSPRDLKSLEDYENNEDGAAITYSGIMSEIELPPSAAFQLGEQIPLANIVSYGSNMMKIKQNYDIANPDKPLDINDPNYYRTIMAFAKKMGYGGVGTSSAMLQANVAKAKAFAKANSNNPESSKAKTSYLNEVVTSFNKVPRVTVTDLTKSVEEGGYGGSMLDKLITTQPGKSGPERPELRKILKNKSQVRSLKRNLSERGVDATDFRPPWNSGEEANLRELLFNKEYGLKESYEILPSLSNKVAERVFDGLEIVNGKLSDYIPEKGMYRMDGELISNENELDDDIDDGNRGSYKILGTYTAMKAGDGKNGKQSLLMNAYDGDEIDIDATNQIDEGYRGEYGGSESIMTTVIALENEKTGDVYYKEVELGDPAIRNALQNVTGADDDITKTVQQEKDSVAQLAAIEANTTEQQIIFDTAKKQLDREVFSDPSFEMESEEFYGEGSGGQLNRNNMMKSFYMALDFSANRFNPDAEEGVNPKQVQSYIDSNAFSAFTQDIKEDLNNYDQGNTEELMVLKWLESANADVNSLSKKKNELIASKWIQLLKIQ